MASLGQGESSDSSVPFKPWFRAHILNNSAPGTEGRLHSVVGQLGRGSSSLWWDAVGTRVWDKELAGRESESLLPPAPAFRWGYVRGLGLRTLDKGLLFTGLNFHWLTKPKWRRRVWPLVSFGHSEPCPAQWWMEASSPYHICLRQTLQVHRSRAIYRLAGNFLSQQWLMLESESWNVRAAEVCCHHSILLMFIWGNWVPEGGVMCWGSSGPES